MMKVAFTIGIILIAFCVGFVLFNTIVGIIAWRLGLEPSAWAGIKKAFFKAGW